MVHLVALFEIFYKLETVSYMIISITTPLINCNITSPWKRRVICGMFTVTHTICIDFKCIHFIHSFAESHLLGESSSTCTITVILTSVVAFVLIVQWMIS